MVTSLVGQVGLLVLITVSLERGSGSEIVQIRLRIMKESAKEKTANLLTVMRTHVIVCVYDFLYMLVYCMFTSHELNRIF